MMSIGRTIVVFNFIMSLILQAQGGMYAELSDLGGGGPTSPSTQPLIGGSYHQQPQQQVVYSDVQH